MGIKSSYIALCPVLRTVQSALHFTSLTDLFTQTPSRLLWEASSHMLQLMCEGCSYTYPPLSIVRYSFMQLSELEVLIPQHRIWTRVLVVESAKVYPWAIALCICYTPMTQWQLSVMDIETWFTFLEKIHTITYNINHNDINKQPCGVDLTMPWIWMQSGVHLVAITNWWDTIRV